MMNKRLWVSPLMAALLLAALILTACNLTGPSAAGPCVFTARVDLPVMMLPDGTSGLFGTLPAGDTITAEARTADGWYGFDPGVAQAANVGLARYRWVLDPLSTDAACAGLPVVTLADVQADVDASTGP